MVLYFTTTSTDSSIICIDADYIHLWALQEYEWHR